MSDVDAVKVQLVLMRAAAYASLNRAEKRAVIVELKRRGVEAGRGEDEYGISRLVYEQQRRRWHKSPLKRRDRLPVIDEPECAAHEPEQFTTLPVHDDTLNVCRPCKYKTQCLAIVQPRTSHFDGVAGGIAWRNGRPIKRLAPTQEKS